jgi:microcystin-dependent protein
MSEAYLGEVRIFGFPFAPQGWAACNGSLLPIRQYTALFSLLGVNYGGNGTVTFGLPNFADTLAVGVGTMPGGSTYQYGDMGGSDTVTLQQAESPPHAHGFHAAAFRSNGTQNAPSNLNALATAQGCTPYVLASTTPAPVAMSPMAIAPAGTNGPHANLMPFTTVNFCIALQGEFPQRP